MLLMLLMPLLTRYPIAFSAPDAAMPYDASSPVLQTRFHRCRDSAEGSTQRVFFFLFVHSSSPSSSAHGYEVFLIGSAMVARASSTPSDHPILTIVRQVYARAPIYYFRYRRHLHLLLRASATPITYDFRQRGDSAAECASVSAVRRQRCAAQRSDARVYAVPAR